MGIGNILGAAVPVAAGFMTGGASTPFLGMSGAGAGIAAGALAGAGISALTGQDMLTGAITGGLGGMGGADLATGLGSFGGTTAANNAIKASMVQNPMSAALTSSGAIPGAVSGAQNAFMNPMLSTAGGQGIQTALPGATGIGSNAMTAAGGRGIPQTTNLAGKIGAGGYVPPNISTGLSEAVKDPMAFFTDYGGGSALKGGLKTAATAGGPLLQGMEPSGISQGQMKADEKYDPNRRLNLSMDTGISKYMSDDYDTGLRLLAQGGPVQKYADGGLSLNLNSGETEGERASLMPPPTVQGVFGQQKVDPNFKAYDPNKDKLTLAPAGTQGGSSSMYGFYDVSGKFNQTDANAPNAQLYNYGPQETTAQQNQGGGSGPQTFGGNNAAAINPAMAAGALQAAQAQAQQQKAPYADQTLGLKSLAGGGYLETGGMLGDGMSDDIKATIEGDQEARLSDGEFVLPADVVSHLGNGSSDAGAKQLYAMMDRLRKDRTGTKEQGKEINPGRYMPA